MTRILNLGAGVQSTTLLLLACRGVLPKPDLAIFADTGWEPRAVYEHLAWLEGVAAEHGVRVVRVGSGNIKADALRSQVRGTKEKGQRWASLPYFTDAGDGGGGMIRRQCTREYKIDPINAYVRREVLGLAKGQRAPRTVVVERWMGISADEPQRMRDSKEPWARNVYPLCGIPYDYLGKPWRRYDCLAWLAEHYPERAIPRSACIGCPYHSNDEWRRLRDDSPDEWADAVSFDRAIRNMGGKRGRVYLHRDRKPLDEVDLRTDDEKGQPSLFGSECEGMCGV